MKNERKLDTLARNCVDRAGTARSGAPGLLRKPGRPALLHAVVARCSVWLIVLLFLAGGVAPDVEATA